MVYVLLADGFEEAEAIVPADLLRRSGAEVALVGVTGPVVTGGHGIAVNCDLTLEQADPEQMEMLVIPGGMGGVENIQMDLFAMALIQKAADRGSYLAAICAAPTLLGYLGIVDRRRAVCYPGLEDEMGSAVVQKGAIVVKDGRIITAEGAGAAFDFGLKLVETLKGADTAKQVAHDVCWRH